MHDPGSTQMSEQLRTALAALVDGLPPRRAAAAVERLMTAYRGPTPTGTPVLRDRADVVAYAAYRMPATFEAVSAALGALADRLPGWSPGTHLDLGGGTGAATWAAAATWPDGRAVHRPDATEDGQGTEGTEGTESAESQSAPEGPEDGGTPAAGTAAAAETTAATRRTTVLDWAEPALALGAELAAAATSPALRGTLWQRRRLDPAALTEDAALPESALVTVSYVLGELTEEGRHAVVEAAARAGRAVVLVEPGTPDGYLRIIEARERLIDAGLTVLAPCPHSAKCPMVPGEDWCHFAARVGRSSLHRQVKGGSLPYEDEKFSYVAAVRPELAGSPAPSRIVRRPLLRKGQVLLDLCTAEEELRRTTVSKRQGPAYRAARDAEWGDRWPPEPGPPPNGRDG